MALTDHCDFYGAAHEDGFNLLVRHIMSQRPSLFNYATNIFHQQPHLFCQKIDAAKKVRDAGNPLFTEIEPLPIFGTPVPIGLNFCLQLSQLQIDFHPSNVFPLPPELGQLGAQRFGLRMKACAGLGCPGKELLDLLVPAVETLVVRQRELLIGNTKENPFTGTHDVPQPDPAGAATATKPRPTVVLPTRELLCFCLEVYAVGHFEWGPVPGSQQQWLKPRLDGLEIVDVQPTPLENSIECYLISLLKLGILPKLMIPIEKLILDVTKVLKKQGLNIGENISILPAAVPADVPNNPAIEDNQVKGFMKLSVV